MFLGVCGKCQDDPETTGDDAQPCRNQPAAPPHSHVLAAQAKRRLNQLGGKISAGAPYSWLQFAHATSVGPTLLVTSCQP
jgi:hypothetical protein